jgi:hypothetical protein
MPKVRVRPHLMKVKGRKAKVRVRGHLMRVKRRR